jgi:5-enolpyruvylshikimate-3-phosphate synthase
VAGTRSSAVLDGSAGLRKRPMDRIAEPLRLMGADVATSDGRAPITISPAPLHGMDYTLPIASAQVKSCLELAALGADAPVTLHEPGPSRDHTARMFRAMGATVVSDGLTETVHPATSLKPLDGTLPGDISSAAFLLAAAAIVPGSRVTVSGVGLNPTRTGVLDVLSAMGAHISVASLREEFGEPVGDVTLEAAIPFGDQPGRWTEKLRRRYNGLIDRADTVTVLQYGYTPDCMMRRNRYMVDRSSLLLAVYDGKPGGTMSTLLYAGRQGLRTLIIDL